LIEKKLPWGVILLLGGGFALSDACTKTGEKQHSLNRTLEIDSKTEV
jgi:di/tricarboxylate transporter